MPWVAKSASQRVPMMEMSGGRPPAMSVVSFWNRVDQVTTSILISMPGLAWLNSLAMASNVCPVLAL